MGRQLFRYRPHERSHLCSDAERSHAQVILPVMSRRDPHLGHVGEVAQKRRQRSRHRRRPDSDYGVGLEYFSKIRVRKAGQKKVVRPHHIRRAMLAEACTGESISEHWKSCGTSQIPDGRPYRLRIGNRTHDDQPA